MGISLDGLASGLDTTALISSIMQAEALPQTLLKNKSYDVQSMVSALQGLNTKVAALATQATAAAKPGALDLYSATTSSDKVVATTTATAKAGALDFQVTKLAQTQVTVTDKVVGWPYTTMTINSGGQTYTITPLTSSLDDVVNSVNAAGAGVTASKVSVGGGEFRLQFSATKSGAAGAFTISDAGTPFTDVKTAQDAEIALWPGTTAAQTVKSPTNTFTDLLPGVSVTAKEVTPAPATLTVGRDDAGITKVASDLVDGVNGIFALVASKTAVSTTTTSTGTTTTAGVFAGDPAGTAAKVQEIAGRIATAATTASDKYNGTLTTTITGQQSEVRDLADRIGDWDTRLASRKATLERTYSGLEVALSNMNAQKTWLTSQLAGLSSGSSSS
jgi:flagellar hook-associated protein 2